MRHFSLFLLAGLLTLAPAARAQDAAIPAERTEPVEGTIPSTSDPVSAPFPGLGSTRFINPRARVALPEPMPGPVLRFVVADDFPPFAFIDGAGRLAGLHIDLVRSVCATLDLPCTLQARRFDQVLGAVEEDPNNLVLVAGLTVRDGVGPPLNFSLPYYRFAARFVGVETDDDAPLPDDWLDEATLGVVQNTAHAALLQQAYGQAQITTYPTTRAMMRGLRRGEVAYGFGDGVDLAIWLGGSQSNNCCAFFGDPVFSLAHFGEGLAFAVPAGQPQLVQALNAALARLEESGDMERIMLTAFPLDPLGP